MQDQREDGHLFAIAGQSRWGKTWWTIQQVKPAARALCWDPRGEYLSEGFERVQSIPQLAGLLREIGDQAAKLAYWGPLDDFDSWCTLAYTWGQLWPAALVVEEIADVTHAGKASGGLGELIRKGLFYGNHIYCSTQRPQETSKTIWGNPTCIHSHGFIAPADQAYIAARLAVPVEEVAALKKYQWLERWAGDEDIKRGGPV